MQEPLPLRERLRPLYDTAKKKVALAALATLLFGAGAASGWLLRRRRG